MRAYRRNHSTGRQLSNEPWQNFIARRAASYAPRNRFDMPPELLRIYATAVQSRNTGTLRLMNSLTPLTGKTRYLSHT